MARTLARSASKIAFYVIIMLAVTRSLADPESCINHDIARQTAQLISGDVNADSLYDAFFYLDVVSVVAITTAIYFITMKLFKKIRSK